MPPYDNAAKTLFTLAPHALCAWLGVDGGAGLQLVRISEQLPSSTFEVDVLGVVGERLAVQIELQAHGERDFPTRILSYKVHLLKRPDLAGKEIVLHAVLLGRGTLDPVHHLRDDDPDELLATPALAPLAPLGRARARHPRRAAAPGDRRHLGR